MLGMKKIIQLFIILSLGLVFTGKTSINIAMFTVVLLNGISALLDAKYYKTQNQDKDALIFKVLGIVALVVAIIFLIVNILIL